MAMQTIATTVERLGDRMKAMEQAAVPTASAGADAAQPIDADTDPQEQLTADIPSVSELRGNTALNHDVQRRLSELDFIDDINEPHIGSTAQLPRGKSSGAEFTYGYLHMVDQQGSKFDRDIMWDLLKMMMEDVAEYPWANVKNFFRILGSHIENDRVKWFDTQSIQQLRAKHAQKYEIPTKKGLNQPSEKLKYCVSDRHLL